MHLIFWQFQQLACYADITLRTCRYVNLPKATSCRTRTFLHALPLQALTLIRVLCESSATVAQLLRTGGLLARAQTLLAIASASASKPATAGLPLQSTIPSRTTAAASSATLAIHNQLMLIECLRIWRAAVTHGVYIMHMDDMFQYLCNLATPAPLPCGQPSSASASSVHSNGVNCAASDEDPGGASTLPQGRQGGVDAAVSQLTMSNDTGPACSAPLQAAVQWQVLTEYYLLLDALLRHTRLVEAGDATLGRPMITVSCAAALAQQAVQLLQAAPGHLCHPLQARAAAVSGNGSAADARPAPQHQEQSASNAAPDLRRLVPGRHAVLLIPAEAAPVAALASVAGFLASYWVGIQHATEDALLPLQNALQQLGMADMPVDQGTTSEACMASVGETDNASGNSQTFFPMLTAAVCSSTTSSRASGRLALLRHSAHCSLLYSLYELADAVYREPQSRRAVFEPTLMPLISGLSTKLLHRVAGAAASSAAMVPSRMQSYHLAASQMVQSDLHLFVKCGQLAVQCMGQSAMHQKAGSFFDSVFKQGGSCENESTSSPESKPNGADGSWLAALLDGALAVLPLAAPGNEAVGLRALLLATMQPVLDATLQLAVNEITSLPDSNARAAAAAGGANLHELNSTEQPPAASTHVEASYPQPVTIDLAHVRRCLFEGYSASWLSMAAVQPPSTSATSDQDQGSASLPLRGLFLDTSSSSRLPASPHWLLSEILAVPRPPVDSSSQKGAAHAAGASSVAQGEWETMPHPVGCALLLALGLHAGSSGYLRLLPAHKVMQSAVKLAFMYNSSELLQLSKVRLTALIPLYSMIPDFSVSSLGFKMHKCVQAPVTIVFTVYSTCASFPLAALAAGAF